MMILRRFLPVAVAIVATALFAQHAVAQSNTFRLTVSQGVAKGTSYITTTPAGIDARCSATPCTHDFPAGAEVVISVDGSPSSFTWAGACAGIKGNTCRVKMDANKSVSIERRNFTITYIRSDHAGILVGNPGNLTFSAAGHKQVVSQGETITITQWPHRGGGGPDVNKLVKWEGSCAGQAIPTCTLVMDSDKTLTAQWADAQATQGEMVLKILSLGRNPGHGSDNPGVYRVTPPGKIVSDCRTFTGGCVERFAKGTTVTIERLGSSNMEFDRWGTGCDSQTRTTCTVKMDANRTVEGYFIYTGP